MSSNLGTVRNLKDLSGGNNFTIKNKMLLGSTLSGIFTPNKLLIKNGDQLIDPRLTTILGHYELSNQPFIQ
jgi:hypothetical protein